MADDPTQVKDLAKAQPAKLQACRSSSPWKRQKQPGLPAQQLDRRHGRRRGPGRRRDASVRLYGAVLLHAGQRSAGHPEPVVQDHRRDHGAGRAAANGVLVTQGGRFAGWGLYLKDGKPTFTYEPAEPGTPKWQAKEALTAGQAHDRRSTSRSTRRATPFGHGGRACSRWTGRRRAKTRCPHHALHLRLGRDLRRRHGYRHVGGRQGLPEPGIFTGTDRQDHRGPRRGARCRWSR